MALQLEFQVGCEVEGLPSEAQFRSWLTMALRAVDRDSAELSLRIVDTAESQQLNSDYRDKNQPTNVLSFPWQSDFPELAELESNYLGDLAICAEIVQREVVEQQKLLEAHWAHLSIHGLLHLLGFDHIDAAEAQVMESLEISILSQLHYPNPYETS